MRVCDVIDLGRLGMPRRLTIQHRPGRAAQPAKDETLLFVEHPHVVTMGRNGKQDHVLASDEILAAQELRFTRPTGAETLPIMVPARLVGYPIVDLREWKRDVRAYFRGVEQTLIDALAVLGIEAGRDASADTKACG